MSSVDVAEIMMLTVIMWCSLYAVLRLHRIGRKLGLTD